MTKKSDQWDEAIERFKQTGKMSDEDRHLALTSCPTCCDTGMDEGKFCEDCKTGKSPGNKILG